MTDPPVSERPRQSRVRSAPASKGTWIVPDVSCGASDVARHYDELEPLFRALWGGDLHHGVWEVGRESFHDAALRALERVADLAGIERGQRVVDVGCGSGEAALHLTRTREVRVTGVTISRAQWTRARSHPADMPRPPTFRCEDWQTTGLEDASQDAAISLECLGHLPNKRRFFEQLARVLRPGGTVGMTAWLCAEEPTGRQRERLLEPICVEGKLPSLGSADAYSGLACDAGFRVTAFEDWSDSVRRTWSYTLRRAARLVATDRLARRQVRDLRRAERLRARMAARVWLAYRTGALRYGAFALRREG